MGCQIKACNFTIKTVTLKNLKCYRWRENSNCRGKMRLWVSMTRTHRTIGLHIKKDSHYLNDPQRGKIKLWVKITHTHTNLYLKT